MKSVEPALIPAAGKGTRLRPITRHLSKPLLPVGSDPVIQYTIREALDAGCPAVRVIRGAGDVSLHRYVRDQFDDRVRLVVQEEPKGLADALFRGYWDLDAPGRCAVLLPDNVVLDGKGIGSLLSLDEDDTVLGTIRVERQEAEYFGNSGAYEAESLDPNSGLEQIQSLQEKGEKNFRRRHDKWPARRTVPRYLLTREFFERAADRSPDPETGEVDDVPILRSMIKSTRVLGFPVDGDIFDMGTPERYQRLNKVMFERSRTPDETEPTYD